MGFVMSVTSFTCSATDKEYYSSIHSALLKCIRFVLILNHSKVLFYLTVVMEYAHYIRFNKILCVTVSFQILKLQYVMLSVVALVPLSGTCIPVPEKLK